MLSTAEVGSPAPASLSLPPSAKGGGHRNVYMCSPNAFDKTQNLMVAKMVICDLGDGTVWGRVTILTGKC